MMMEPVRAASVAWYVTGRFYAATDKTTQDMGVFPAFAGSHGV